MRYYGTEYFSEIDGPQSVKASRFASQKLFKGGGGGDGGAAQRAAAEKARIAAATNKLNQVFGLIDAEPEYVDKNSFYRRIPIASQKYQPWGSSQQQRRSVFDEEGYNAAVKASKDKADKIRGNAKEREKLYSKVGTDATNVGLTDINKERGIAERELGFILARQGLAGGSRDIDANKDVLDTYNQGVLKASNLGTQIANNARKSDESTRIGLINSINAGLTDSEAVSQAYSGMANNAKQAQDEANLTSLQGFFDVLRQQQANNQYQQGVNSVVNQTQTTPYKTIKGSYGGNVRSY